MDDPMQGLEILAADDVDMLVKEEEEAAAEEEDTKPSPAMGPALPVLSEAIVDAERETTVQDLLSAYEERAVLTMEQVLSRLPPSS